MRRRYSLCLLFFLLMALPPFKKPVEAREIVFITHKHVNVSLEREELKQIFLGKMTRWEDDVKISFVLFTEQGLYVQFLKAFLRKTSSQYINYWKKQVFTGKGRMPKTFKNPQDVIDFVADTEGAISFVNRQAADLTRVNILSLEK